MSPIVSPEDFAARAGMADATVREKTGCGWAEWVALLDAAGAARMNHAAIARHLGETTDISGWWAQSVTVGYERIKGLRAVGQRRAGGTFEASKSRTYAVPVTRVYQALADEGQRARWLPGVALKVRAAIPDKSLRMSWPDGTAVQAWLTPKGPAKVQLAIQHAGLPDADAVAARKQYWGGRLEALAALL